MNNDILGSDDAEVGNSADSQQIKQARKRETYRVAQQKADLQRLLTQPEFRRFAWRLLEQCGVFKQVGVDESEAFLRFHEGKRNIGLRYLAEIGKANPNALIEMMQARDTNQTTNANPKANV
jgi:hypothetical protein